MMTPPVGGYSSSGNNRIMRKSTVSPGASTPGLQARPRGKPVVGKEAGGLAGLPTPLAPAKNGMENYLQGHGGLTTHKPDARDSVYWGKLTGLQQGLADYGAQNTFDQDQLHDQFYDPNDPNSRMNMLNRAYVQRQARDLGQFASSGHLYSGAHEAADFERSRDLLNDTSGLNTQYSDQSEGLVRALAAAKNAEAGQETDTLSDAVSRAQADPNFGKNTAIQEDLVKAFLDRGFQKDTNQGRAAVDINEPGIREAYLEAMRQNPDLWMNAIEDRTPGYGASGKPKATKPKGHVAHQRGSKPGRDATPKRKSKPVRRHR